MASTVQHSRLLQTYFYEQRTRGKRGAAQRTAQIHSVSRQWVERLAKRHAKEAERIPVVPVAESATQLPVQPLYDALLVDLVLAPCPIRHNTQRHERTTEMRIGVYVVLCATVVTVLCCVTLPAASLVVVPCWGMLLRELSRALRWEHGHYGA